MRTTVCQITFLPLYTGAVIERVDKVIDLIKKYDVEVEVHDLSTTVRGDTPIVFDMIKEVYNEMADQGDRFRLHVELLSPR